jgi:hypothetical protein
MRTAAARLPVLLEPGPALALWTDTSRWASFVEGFGHCLELDQYWPDQGSKVVWQSGPGGRGRVTERVIERGDTWLVTQVYEEALSGKQRFAVLPHPEGGSVAELTLDYELNRRGPLRAVADWIFIRRALRDSLRRTLRRFAVEAEEEAELR